MHYKTHEDFKRQQRRTDMSDGKPTVTLQDIMQEENYGLLIKWNEIKRAKDDKEVIEADGTNHDTVKIYGPSVIILCNMEKNPEFLPGLQENAHTIIQQLSNIVLPVKE